MKFAIGERVTYYPRRKDEQDNRHVEVEVKGVTRTGRYRIEGESGGGHVKATVSAKRLARQQILEV